MGTNVHALELTRSPHGVGKPDRAEVEAAVRTIIRWSGDNPERDGLDRNSRARRSRAGRVLSSAMVRIRRRSCRNPSMRSKAMMR